VQGKTTLLKGGMPAPACRELPSKVDPASVKKHMMY